MLIQQNKKLLQHRSPSINFVNLFLLGSLINKLGLERSKSKKIDTHFRSIVNDQKRRRAFEKRELENLVIKSVLSSDKGQPLLRTDLIKNFGRLALIRCVYRKMKRQKGTITRVRNRCIVTGRSSSIGHLGISRIIFRQQAGLGKIPGLEKI